MMGSNPTGMSWYFTGGKTNWWGTWRPASPMKRVDFGTGSMWSWNGSKNWPALFTESTHLAKDRKEFTATSRFFAVFGASR
jgi:hypothetical protein